MTKHTLQVVKARQADATPTPVMIDAGVSAYLALDREWDSLERIVTDVYEAMVLAARQSNLEVCQDRPVRKQSHWWLP